MKKIKMAVRSKHRDGPRETWLTVREILWSSGQAAHSQGLGLL